MINSTKQRFLFVVDGAVNTTVGSDNLGKGQFMIADALRADAGGLRPATNLSSVRKDEKRFKILVGEDKKHTNSRSFVHGASESEVFSLSQIKEIRQTSPKILEPQVDEWVIGWNGRPDSPETSFKFTKNSKPFNLFMSIEGGRVPYAGGGLWKEEVDFTYVIDDSSLFETCQDADRCDPVSCGEIVEDIVKKLRNRRTSGGRYLHELVDITPLISCYESTSTDTLTYYTISVCDTGDQNALSQIENFYPNLPIKRLTRHGAITTYQTLADSAPAQYTTTNVRVIPTCDVCPGGWSTIAGGFVYVVTVVDEGADESTNIEQDLGANVVSVERQGTESGTNVGVYSVLSSEPLTPTNIAALSASFVSATVSLIGEKDTVCSSTSTVNYTWAAGETCDISQDTYSIVLPDNDCGQTRLDELQKAYPDFTVSISSTETSSVVTLTGTSGTANINIGGVNYLATYATSLSVTATNFVSTHQAALTALGFSVSDNTGVLTIISNGNVTVTNVTTNLAGTVVNTALPSTEACSTRYNAIVGTNMVCEECDPIFENFFTSEAPDMYDGVQWTILDRASHLEGDGENCLCGISIKSKMFTMNPDSRYLYKYPYIETSSTIFVDAGFQTYEDLRTSQQGFSVSSHKFQKSWKKDRDMLAGDLLPLVRHSNMYSHGYATGYKFMEDEFRGMSLPIDDLSVQMVQYAIDIDHNREQQGFRSRDGVTRTINFFVEYGKHLTLEAEINKLASAAGKQVLSV